MKPLIEIQIVAISFELKVTNAQYKTAETTAQLEMNTEKGGLRIKSSPVKLNIDTYEARKSAGNGSVIDSVNAYGQKGKQAAYSATARYAQEGQIHVDAKFNEEAFQQIADLRLKNGQHKTPNIKWIPDQPVNIEYQPGDLTIKYETDKLNFDLQKDKTPMEFVPGDIELVVTQKPEVIIKYVGGPIYVPPSADPNYEPPEE